MCIPSMTSSDEVVIATHALTREYHLTQREAGFFSTVKSLFHRKRLIKQALLPLDLQIYRGQIVGLVGGNGAGKTTLLKLLSGLIFPSHGQASVLGYTPWERSTPFLRSISLLLGQKNQLWWDIAPSDSFDLLISIYDLEAKPTLKRIEELSLRLDCRQLLKTPLRRLSLGERMKMELIGSLLHHPQVLFLDEPTIGLDLVAQTNIRSFILEELKGSGVTIILTSHYMDDIALLADRLLLMSHGAIAYDGTVSHFMSTIPMKKRLIVDFSEPLAETLLLGPGITIAKGCLNVDQVMALEQLPHCLKILASQTPLRDLKIEEPEFEDVIHAFLEKESRLRQTGHSSTMCLPD